MSAFGVSRRWLFRVLACVGLVALAAGPARAGTVTFPADGSSITLTLPEGWTAAEEDHGLLKCTSPDGDVNFELLPGTALADLDANLTEAADGLAKGMGLSDVKTRDAGEQPNPNGVKIAGFIIDGRKDNVEYIGVISILTPPSGERCAFQCFGPKGLLLVHSKDMRAITASFKAAR